MDLVATNKSRCRVHTIGIGDGASKALVKGCADKGKGSYVFLTDNEDVSGKVIELLQKALSPAITSFNLNFDETVVECIMPNPRDMPIILKNEPINIFVEFKHGFAGGTKFTVAFEDSIEKRVCRFDLILKGDEPSYPFLQKMA